MKLVGGIGAGRITRKGRKVGNSPMIASPPETFQTNPVLVKRRAALLPTTAAGGAQ